MTLTFDINGQRFTVELSEAVSAALRTIAERNGLSLDRALEQAITNEKFLEDQVQSGGRLLVEKNNEIRQLVRQPA